MATSTISQRVDTQESHLLYNGTVHYDFDPVSHIHYINGKPAYGVTTALGIIGKPFLVQWAANQAADEVKRSLVPGQTLDELQIQEIVANAKSAHRKTKDSAADAGTYIHNWIEEFVHGNNPAMPVAPKLKRTIEAFKSFWEENQPKVLHAERAVCDPDLYLAGIPDLICEVKGKLTVMDWKTGSSIYPEMFLQLGAYAHMYEKEFPDQKVEQLWIVNASVKNMFKTECRSEVGLFKKTYLQAFELYRNHKKVTELLKGGKHERKG